MQILLSCAKDMNTAAAGYRKKLRAPLFQKEAQEAIEKISSWNIDKLQHDFKCSEEIAAMNLKRFRDFLNEGERIPACLLYDGVAYRHLKAEDFNEYEKEYADRHLWITSFLYGLLRPMDGIRPYRMEGNIRPDGENGPNRFHYWKPRLTDLLIESVQADDRILYYLSTEEMTRLFDWKRICEEVRVIEPQFIYDDGKKEKTLSVHAKMCRGAMTRYIITNRINSPDELKGFTYNGYEYDEKLSSEDRPVFICRK